MQGLLFPIIMLTVTLVGGGLLLLVLKSTKKRPVSDEANVAMQTAQQFVNVRDIKDKYLYTKDGLVLTFLWNVNTYLYNFQLFFFIADTPFNRYAALCLPQEPITTSVCLARYRHCV